MAIGRASAFRRGQRVRIAAHPRGGADGDEQLGMGMANQSVCASKAAGRSRISRPLTTSPCATETTKAVSGFRTENAICS